MLSKGFFRVCGALCVGVFFIAAVWGVMAAPQDAPFLVYIPTVARRAEPFTAYTGLITSDRDGDDDVYLIDADGQNLRARTVNSYDDNNPLWSPDASRFLFEQEDDDDDALYIADTNGSEARLLAGLPGDDFNASWSADGQTVAFINQDETFSYALYLVTPDDVTEPRRIATDVSDYAWSPLNDALLLTTLHSEEGQFVTDLFIITDTAVTSPTLLAADIRNYQWSPNGQWVVFTATRAGDDEVYVSSLDGQSGYQVTDNEVDDTFAGWTEGGASVLVLRDAPGGRQLYVADADGTHEEAIAADPGEHYVAGIRQDGREVVYGRRDESAQYLYLQPVRGGAPTLIANPLCVSGCGFINVSWSSNYQYVTYQAFSQPMSGQFQYNIFLVTRDIPIPTYDLLSAASDTPVWLPGTDTVVYYHEIDSHLPAIPYAHNISTGQRYPLGAEGERVQVFDWRVLNFDSR